ncbi:Hypothetical_protein [Hexamita inflata]|uniref:Hypothetical_protein n=1 Tax=Hexamita inflata TaxID=28002 RepID=A0AA86PHB9_9EUKA|nr:Hypothetical protein HINF_LOCUS26021 [Hexamita inflata]
MFSSSMSLNSTENLSVKERQRIASKNYRERQKLAQNFTTNEIDAVREENNQIRAQNSVLNVQIINRFDKIQREIQQLSNVVQHFITLCKQNDQTGQIENNLQVNNQRQNNQVNNQERYAQNFQTQNDQTWPVQSQNQFQAANFENSQLLPDPEFQTDFYSFSTDHGLLFITIFFILFALPLLFTPKAKMESSFKFTPFKVETREIGTDTGLDLIKNEVNAFFTIGEICNGICKSFQDIQ